MDIASELLHILNDCLTIDDTELDYLRTMTVLVARDSLGTYLEYLDIVRKPPTFDARFLDDKINDMLTFHPTLVDIPNVNSKNSAAI